MSERTTEPDLDTQTFEHLGDIVCENVERARRNVILSPADDELIDMVESLNMRLDALGRMLKAFLSGAES